MIRASNIHALRQWRSRYAARWFLPVVLMCCLASTALAQRQVSGTVTADGSGNPLDGATVCAAHAANDYTGWECASTDTNGSYQVENLEARNDYVVWVDHPGQNAYFREMHDNLPCCNFPDGTPVDLTTGNALIDFSLAPSGSIAGQVTDSLSGDPLPGVVMRLWEDCRIIDTAYTVTDDGGFYFISSVPDGAYYMSAFGRPSGYVSELYPDNKVIHPCAKNFIGAQAIVFQDQTRLEGFDYALDRGAAIRGRISAPGNGTFPLNFMRARLYDAADGTQYTTSGANEADGTYEIIGLSAGSYHVVLTGQRFNEHTGSGFGLIDERHDNVKCPRNSCPTNLGQVISVSGTQEVTGVDALLETGALVRGHLTDANTGDDLSNFCVAFYNDEGVYASFACSDENGDYESGTGLPEGDYLLSNQFFINDPLEVRRDYIPQVWKADGSFGSCGNPCDFLQGDTFTVSGLDPVEGIDLAMELGVTIIGQVLVNGEPLAGAGVALLDGNSGQEITRVHTGDGTDLAVGDYVIEGLGSGGYYLRTYNGQGFEDRLHGEPGDIACNPDCDPFEGELIEITPMSEAIFIDFDLTPSARIQGRVIDPLTGAVAGIRVEAYNALGHLSGSGFSNTLGDYEIGGLGGGRFYVRTQDAFGFADVLYDGLPCPSHCNPRDGTPIDLTDGAVMTGIDLVLSPAATIHGRVTGEDADGVVSDLPGTVVQVYSEFGSLAAETVTDIIGNYEVGGLTPGAYHVVTRNGGEFIDQGADGAFCSLTCDPLSTGPVNVQAGQTRRVDFDLFVANSLFVQVRHENGRGLSGITVAAFNETGDEYTRGATNASGRMELFGFPPGDYFLRTFNDQGFVEQVYDGLPCTETCDPLQGTRITLDELGAASAEFTLSGGFSIKGLIRKAGVSPAEGIAGVRVLLLENYGDFRLRGVDTTADGRYEFTGLPNGEYFLRSFGQHGYIDRVFGGGQCTPGRCFMTDGSIITVDGQNVAGINLSLSPGKEFSGYAMDPDEVVITEGWAVLFGESGEWLSEFARLNEDGTFLLDGIAPGSYFLFLRSLNSQLVDTLYDGIPCPGFSCDITSGTPIELEEGASKLRNTGRSSPDKIRIVPEGVAVTVTATIGFAVHGSATTDAGDPVRSTRIYFFNEDGDPAGEAITDGQGQFVSTAGLSDGTYFAATSRAARPEDEPDEAEDAEDGAGPGLQDQAWSGFPCDGLCAPSEQSGIGTAIVVSGADVGGVDFVLERKPGLSIETLTNGVGAGTPNGGDAPEIGAGEAIEWTYTVTNVGPASVQSIVVTDSNGAAVDCPGSFLAQGASMNCTADGTALDLSQDPFDGVLGYCAGVPATRLSQTTGSVSAMSGGNAVADEDDSHYCNPQDNKMQLNAGLSDAWFYPPTAGQGFFIHVWEEINFMFLAWFTYDKDRPPPDSEADLGEAGHRWLTAQGGFSGNRADLAVISSSGGEFDKGTGVENEVDGSIVVVFENCEKGTVTYDIDSINQQGVVPIQRITLDNVPACEERDGIGEPETAPQRAPRPDSHEGFHINWGMNDAWYNPDTNGQGFLIVVFPVIEQVFMAWFTYETERPDDSVPALLGEAGHRWLTAQGSYADDTAELDVVITEGGRFDSATSATENRLDGTLTLQFTGCNEGTVSYDIPSIGRQGVVPIERITLDMVPICEELEGGAPTQ